MTLFRNLDNNNDQFGQNHELSLQESQFAEMIKEMSCYDFPQNTLSMFLQYCPESVTHLFDKCIMPLGVQVNLIFSFHLYFQVIVSSCISSREYNTLHFYLEGPGSSYFGLISIRSWM